MQKDRHSGMLLAGIQKNVQKLDPGFRRGDVQLNDIVAPNAVPNGFYVAQGPVAAVPRVLDQIVDLFHQESEMPAAQSVNRTHVGRLFWIDSGNSFDAYHVARSAARRGLNPHRVLRAIQVARPFTAFQFQQMLEKIPMPLTLPSPRTGRGEGVRVFSPLVIVSDLMGLFYDSEIPEHDAHRSFHRFVSGLMTLRERAVVLALLHEEHVPASRASFLPRIINMATLVQRNPIPVKVREESPIRGGGWIPAFAGMTAA